MDNGLNFNYVKRTQKDYSMSFKLQVVQEVESRQLSLTQAAAKYGIPAKSSIREWIQKYGNLDRELQVKFTMEKTPEQQLIEPEAKVRLLEKQKNSLEQQLKFQQDKAIVFDIMVDIAEKEFNTPIRKKSVPEASNDSNQNKEPQ